MTFPRQHARQVSWPSTTSPLAGTISIAVSKDRTNLRRDGKNLDSPNHQDHMYNTVKGMFQNAGPCPSTHPVRMPQLAFETMWNTTQFNDKSMWPTDGSQPFVWSFDDSKGYGTHGDYMFGKFPDTFRERFSANGRVGWKGDALQRAMDSTAQVSNNLKTQTVAEANKCAIKNTVTEPIDGCKSC